MAKLKKKVELETAFSKYVVDETLGEGGAGCVYGGVDEGGTAIALKVLRQSSSDKRRRFKNEIAFLSRTRHENIMKVLDHGLADQGGLSGPFYVMPRYSGSLRDVIAKGLPSQQVMPIFSQILDGVEAAHLLKVTHRDLKPENVLVNAAATEVAIGDFGVACFTQEQIHTIVETQPTQRLANFQYAAPEQRTPGQPVDESADIYALGMILNEMFTGRVPHGTEYKLIASVSQEHAYLDPIVAQLLRSEPGHRPSSIAVVKQLIQKHHAEAVTLQKLSALENVVIPVGEVDDPLAHEPPKLVGVNWKDGKLTLELDRPVNGGWVQALHNMGSYTSVLGCPPVVFNFSGKTASVSVRDNSAQAVIDHFKGWLPRATVAYKLRLEAEMRRIEAQRIEQLCREKEKEERNLRLNQSLKI